MKFCSSNLVTDATLEPVTLAEAKAQVRVTHSHDDTYLTDLIKAARRWVEDYTKKALITQTWSAQFNDWHYLGDYFELPRSPLLTVTSVKYWATDDTETTVTSTNYIVETGFLPGRVVMKSSYALPSLQEDRLGRVSIVYTAGYGAAADNVPEEFKLGIKLLLTHLYVNRSPVVTGTITAKVPLSVQSVLGFKKRVLI